MDAHELLEMAAGFRDRDMADPESFPKQNISELFAAHAISGPVPEDMGGRGWSALEAVEAIRVIASQSPSTALVVSMPLGLAGACFATDPDLASADWRVRWREQTEWAAGEYRAAHIFGACNSERGAGSALTSISTVARLAGDGFEVTGEKILASGGRHASWFFSTAKVDTADLPGAGAVEFFLLPVTGRGVEVLDDWDGFGMRSTESHSVRYTEAPAHALLAFPNLIDTLRPLQYWFCLFAAIPLGCARGMIDAVAHPTPASPTMRLRLADAVMRYEALEAYLQSAAAAWRPGADAAYAGRVLRTKTFVSMESTKVCAELFALTGGRSYRRNGLAARLLADSFAGTALRPPLPLALETMIEQFEDVVLRA